VAGYARDDDACTIEPMAQAGDDGGELARIPLSWSADHAAGAGPAARSIRGSEVIVADDLAAEPGTQPWRG